MVRCHCPSPILFVCHHPLIARHHSHGSIVQFRYGEDGVDPTKVSYLYKFDFLVQNCMPLAQKLKQKLDFNNLDVPYSSASSKNSDRFNEEWVKYAADAAGGEEKPTKKKRKKSSSSKLPSLRVLKELLDAKHSSCLSSPGDAVGVIAAQSIGEPSTQMTLNTFHHAGRGEANVTLGIPRLREILMTASKEIGTPFIKVPFMPNMDQEEADLLVSSLKKVKLLEILKNISVTERPLVWDDYSSLVVQSFGIEFSFHALCQYKQQAGVSLDKKMILGSINTDFVQKMKLKLKSFSKKKVTFSYAKDPKDAAAADENGGDAHEDKVDDGEPFTVFLEIQHESLRKIPMLDLCEKVCMACYVNMTSGVESADKIVMQITPKAGESLGEVFAGPVDMAGLLVQGKSGNLLDCLLENGHLVDLEYLQSNDIHMMQETFGIEAAKRVLEIEVVNVFGAYGIQVDPRHLSLVSDFMTHTGLFKGCSRNGTFPLFGSPLLQMSFETATQFLRKSVLFNTQDEMRSPSSNIACGQLVTTSGTGVCDLLYKSIR